MPGIIQHIQKTNYNAKKAISKAVLDAALFLSNIAQLKSILDGGMELGTKAKFGIGMIIISLLLQFIVGIMIIMTLDIEGCLIELKQIGTAGGLISDGGLSSDATVEEVTHIEPATPAPFESVKDRKFILTRRARRLNTAILVFVFQILCLNLIINGLELSKPNIMEELLKQYNITVKQ